MRLINANALIAEMHNVILEDGEDRRIFYEVIERQPTIEPERKKGRWIYNSPVTMKCNQCGLVIKDWDWHRFKYCPNCCADMRDENDDTPDDIPIEYFESGGK